MKRTQWMKIIGYSGVSAGAKSFFKGERASSKGRSSGRVRPGDVGEMVVQLCDGETSTKVKGVSPDERLTPEQAQSVSNELMRMWMDKVDPAKAAAWMKEQSAAQLAAIPTPAPARKPSGSKSKAAASTTRPRRRTSERFHRSAISRSGSAELEREEIKYGDEIFHNATSRSAAQTESPARCVTRTRPTLTLRPIRSFRYNCGAWRCCAT